MLNAEALLLDRLKALGLAGVERLSMHANRTVMLTLEQRHLRIHRGYAVAPDRVLKAIVRFLRGRVPRRMRAAVRHEFLSFPVHLYAPPAERKPRPEPPRPGDLRILHELARIHDRLNRRHFGGLLREIRFRLSGRMRTRLGELSVNLKTGEASEIAISRRHLRNGWAEVEETVLHEMVHQWQVENRLPLDHGPGFRSKACEVGIEPRARRDVAKPTIGGGVSGSGVVTTRWNSPPALERS
jgi:hypothetical protein